MPGHGRTLTQAFLEGIPTTKEVTDPQIDDIMAA